MDALTSAELHHGERLQLRGLVPLALRARLLADTVIPLPAGLARRMATLRALLACFPVDARQAIPVIIVRGLCVARADTAWRTREIASVPMVPLIAPLGANAVLVALTILAVRRARPADECPVGPAHDIRILALNACIWHPRFLVAVVQVSIRTLVLAFTAPPSLSLCLTTL